MKWFLEERTPTSQGFMPALYREKPVLGKNNRVGKTDSRARAQPVEVAPQHRSLSLTALRKIYGQGPQETA